MRCCCASDVSSRQAPACRRTRNPLSLFILGSFFLACDVAGQTDFSPANGFRPDFWDVDGTVNTILATNGKVYLGGAFSYVSPNQTKAAAYDLYTGAQDSQFPVIRGRKVTVVIEDGEGGWFVAGQFVEAAGAPATNLVHILADDSVDLNFAPNPNGEVLAIVLDGTNLFVGGAFTLIGGEARSRIAKLDAATGRLLPWAPEADDTVYSLGLSENNILAGGRFFTIGGRTRRHIAQLDSDGFATSWNPDGDGDVLSIEVVGDRVFVGGSFNRIGGELRNGAAELSLNTGHATAWNPNPLGGKVNVLRTTCDAVYIGGYFTNLAGFPRARVGAVDINTAAATSWNPYIERTCDGTPSAVHTLLIQGNSILVAGEFCRMGGEVREDLAAVDLFSGELRPWAPNPNGTVTALAFAGRRVIAGSLYSPGGVARHNLASLDAVSGKATDWTLNTDGEVFALALQGETLYVGGSFTNIDDGAYSFLAAVNSETGQLLSWNAAPNNAVFALELSETNLFVGGQFTTIGGAARQRLAALDLATAQALPTWFAHADGSVRALARHGNTLYVGGNFVTLRGETRHRLAAVDARTGALQFWNPDLDNTVRTLATDGSALYVGGIFNTVGGITRNYLAAIDTITAAATFWNPNADQEVRALKISDGTIFAGGVFTAAAGESRFGCAAIGSGGQLLAWTPETRAVYALAVSDSAIYAGGAAVDDAPNARAFAAFPQVGAPLIVRPLVDLNVLQGEDAEFQVVAAGTPPLYYEWYFNGNLLLAGPNDTTLSLTAPDVAQSGRYTVLVRNALGAASSEAVLTVLAPVSISVSPQSVIATNNMTAKLTVTASGNPPPVYQWRRNGVNIPGAVYRDLDLPQVTGESGGSFSVVVANRLGALSSEIASLKVIAGPNITLPFSDMFSSRGSIGGYSGTGFGENTDASAESGEPRHADKEGGKSVWLRWTAPGNGLATFSVRGSGFDTLLAIYIGSSVTNLHPVAADDDRGGYLTSVASFNAMAGTNYAIAVDGLSGASGNVSLKWTLNPDAPVYPEITAQPVSVTVSAGGTAAFGVSASSATALRYQWYFGCQPLKGQTNDVLIINNVQTRHVGSYYVLVSNNSASVASLSAALEIGQFSTVRTFDKLEDLLAASASAGGGGIRNMLSSGLGGQALLVQMGNIVSQTFNTADTTTSLRETNHCGVFGGRSAWLRFTNTQSGAIQVDTIGSTFDTILAIYRETNLLTLVTNPSAAYVRCDDSSAPDGIRSLLRYQANTPRAYLAVVDGAGGASGPARIRFRLGLPPTSSTNPPTEMRAVLGSEVTLNSGFGGAIPNPIFQWRLNGVSIPGATSSNLVLASFSAAQAGMYSVVLSNFAGMVTNSIAHLSVDIPVQVRNPRWPAPRQFACEVIGNPGETFVLQTSANLVDWVPVQTNQLGTTPFQFLDTQANPQWRFYRALRR